jgi:hypothetical protein
VHPNNAGFETTAPIWVIEMEEVLVDNVRRTSLLNCLKIESFKSIFSVAASTTKSTPTTPSLMSV